MELSAVLWLCSVAPSFFFFFLVQATLRGLCEELDIPFQAAMLK